MTSSNSEKLSLRAIEVFVTAVEEGGITSAANRLGASPASVSSQLSNLETVLGARLIERSSQRFALTQAGELFHSRAVRILDEVSSARVVLAKAKISTNMVLKIAAVEDFDPVILSPWLMSIQEAYSNIRLNVKSGPSHESHAALGNRSADIIVAVEGMDTPDWVEEHSILNDPYVLVRSAAANSASSLDDLARFPFIRYSRDLLMGRQIEAHLRRSRVVPPRDCECSSNEMVFSMVGAKKGWAITTISAFASVAQTTEPLVASVLPMPAFSRRISLYVRRDSLGDLPTEFSHSLRKVIADRLIAQLEGPLAELAKETGCEVLD